MTWGLTIVLKEDEQAVTRHYSSRNKAVLVEKRSPLMIFSTLNILRARKRRKALPSQK